MPPTSLSLQDSPHWITDTGVKVPTVTENQMREVDRIAVEETGPNLFMMMENAGRNLALAAIGMLGDDWRDARVLVLAGSGGNGGGLDELGCHQNRTEGNYHCHKGA